MNASRNSPLRVAITGLLAGMGGAVALTGLAGAGRRLLSDRGTLDAGPTSDGITVGEALSEGPDLPPNMNRVTATFVQKIATGIFGRSLSAEQQYVAGTAWHLAYGGFWGVVYALLRGSVGCPSRCSARCTAWWYGQSASLGWCRRWDSCCHRPGSGAVPPRWYWASTWLTG